MQPLFQSIPADASHCPEGPGVRTGAEILSPTQGEAYARDRSNPVFRGMMQRLPEAVRGSFSPEQLDAMAEALAPNSGSHAIKFQVSVPVLGRRYYVALFGGRERRSPDRLSSEGQLGRARMAIVYVLALWLFVSVLAAGLGGALYLLKSTKGTDIGQAGLIVPLPFMHGGR